MAKGLAKPGCKARLCPGTLIDFLTAREHHWERPPRAPFKLSTAIKRDRSVRQVSKELYGDEYRIYSMLEPPWDDAEGWRRRAEKGDYVRLDNQRKGLRDYAYFRGQGGKNLPKFLTYSWARAEQVRDAQRRGVMLKRPHFLKLPVDIQRLLAAIPFEDTVRARYRKPRRWILREARYNDAMFHTMIFLGVYTGPRPGEFATLLLENYDPENDAITNWWCPKPQRFRDVYIPESFVWHSRSDPSLDHFLRYVRPMANPNPSVHELFVNCKGEPFSESGAQRWISEAIHTVLDEPDSTDQAGKQVRGKKSPAAHCVRRACATIRHAYGASYAEIADLLDDEEETIKKHYVDRNYKRPRRPDARREAKRENDDDLPPIPLIRSNGTRHARHKVTSMPPTRANTQNAADKRPEDTAPAIPYVLEGGPGGTRTVSRHGACIGQRPKNG